VQSESKIAGNQKIAIPFKIIYLAKLPGAHQVEEKSVITQYSLVQLQRSVKMHQKWKEKYDLENLVTASSWA
jgi:hypothetical protein